ncbi:hypothetical protein GCE9029_01658 [Grimontia celer]|uniref:Methyltransferase domain-containing protein n=1 Tax=Grimontia celer TaxID=1796497 RepID=A0A128EYZ9_9GAMM|nr:hypothetical protein [Grimontia celer]CZF79802.1 hypothetical protein GCE9029_01658 [Grimontia celer]
MKETDWDKYYTNRGTNKITKITRGFTSNKISNLIRRQGINNPRICELGGGDSCVADEIIQESKASYYEVVDNCEKGLSLFKARNHLCESGVVKDSVLNKNSVENFDICLSIGLIEHFNESDTSKAIEYHFKKVRTGGFVLITFPHPTWLYCLTRKILEITGAWKFPDERPLNFEEVTRTCKLYGKEIHRSINWKIILTQGYVLYEKI